MRVGIDARYGFRNCRRGIGEYVAALLCHLPQVAAECDKFFLYVDGPADLQSLRLPDSRFQLRHLRIANPLLWEEVALPTAAAQDRLDLLHMTSNYGPSFSPCATIYTIHDLIEFIRPELGPMSLSLRHAAGRAVRLRTLPRQAREARRVITISQASGDDLIRILRIRANRLRVIPQGVSDGLCAPVSVPRVHAALRAEGYAVPNRYVLAMGALDPRKNGSFLMRGFAEVHEEFPDVGLVMVGVERQSEYTVPFINYPSWLSVHGFVPRETLIRFVQGATIFAYPSLYEGFGLPVLEAMACGVPVLVSNSSSLPEVVGRAGVMFDPRDQGQLTDGLRRLLRDPDLRAACVAASKEQVNRFSWIETTRRTYEVYREALRGTP